MNDIFSEKVKEVIIQAKKLQLAGITGLSEKMCRDISGRAAVFSGQDMLKLFYGNSVYDEIKTPEDAMQAVYIASVIGSIYENNYSKLRSGNWADISVKTCNRDMSAFFSWISVRRRKVSQSDINHFIHLKNALSEDKIYYRRSHKIVNLTLLDIISGLSSGSIIMNGDGELL